MKNKQKKVQLKIAKLEANKWASKFAICDILTLKNLISSLKKILWYKRWKKIRSFFRKIFGGNKK